MNRISVRNFSFPWLKDYRMTLFLLFLFPAIVSAGEEEEKLFRFKLDINDVFIIEKYQDIIIDYGFKKISREEKNKIVLKVIRKEKDFVKLSGKFVTYSRSPRKTGEYHLEKIYFSEFRIYNNGRYEVPDKYTMPNLRDLPSFPNNPIKVKDRWRLPAIETIHTKIQKIKIPVFVNYEYTGPARLIPIAGKISRKNVKYDRIEYNYSINHRVLQPAYPIRHISGFSADELWFNRKTGIPVFDSNRLSYTFIMADGRKTEYNFKILSWYKKIKHIVPEQKNKIIRSIRKELRKEKDIKVQKHKDGVVLTIKDILFDFDSSHLSETTMIQLKKISRILKKHASREIRIFGHTDSRGNSLYNKALSKNRARAVLKALRSHGIEGKRMSYHGYGDTKPVAPNTTTQNRSLNRRVEILIVTE